MAVRIRYKVELAVSSTSAEEKDLGDAAFEVVVDSQNEGGSWKTIVPAGSSDMAIYLSNIATARFVYVRTTAKTAGDTPGAITLKKDSVAGEATVVAPLEGALEGHFMLSTSGVTALYATNSGAVDMALTIFAAGD